MSTETLNLTANVYDYFRAHAFRESPVLAKLREDTAKLFPDRMIMQISPEQGQFMQLLVKVLCAQNIIEVGTFTGYSALWMATAMAPTGKLWTFDVNPETTNFAKNYWEQAGVASKIKPVIGPAEKTLQELIDLGQTNHFDFAFIDADKTGYDKYYELCLSLIRPGGLIAIDNTLQGGKVANSGDHSPNVTAIKNLNDKLVNDKRILLSMLPISDGLTLVYKL
ncbi:MAG: class I SAM-dependent methyltransferase [Proteobacteria bacterium]|nr:class I SAM-dependent methyltransferase [Pseudomonadota bacterium]